MSWRVEDVLCCKRVPWRQGIVTELLKSISLGILANWQKHHSWQFMYNDDYRIAIYYYSLCNHLQKYCLFQIIQLKRKQSWLYHQIQVNRLRALMQTTQIPSTHHSLLIIHLEECLDNRVVRDLNCCIETFNCIL